MVTNKITYVSEIINALNQLGGVASLKEINETIKKNGTLSNILTNPNWEKMYLQKFKGIAVPQNHIEVQRICFTPFMVWEKGIGV